MRSLRNQVVRLNDNQFPQPATIDDLVDRAQRGDVIAMGALVDELSPWVGRICAGICEQHAEDARQNTLVIVLRCLGDLRDPAAIRGWVRRIAVRESIRIATVRRDIPLDPRPDAGSSIDADLAIDVRTTLAELSPQHRAVLVLRHIEDLSEDQVSAVLGVDVGTVKSRASRARSAFARRWT